MERFHEPVLKERVVDFWLNDPDGIYIDATVGGGGHAGALLERLSKSGRCIGLDRDLDAIACASRNLKDFREQVIFFHANFSDLPGILEKEGVVRVNGILADLGISSHQINTSSKGFSYRFEGPLDMRMNRSDDLPAGKIVNTFSMEELVRIFRVYGEERHAGRIARAIDSARRTGKIETTTELAEIVRGCVPGRFAVKSLSRIFQALRIAVNREVESLHTFLDALPGLLVAGGRAVILSYHSLEDRPVKQAFRFYCRGGEVPPFSGTAAREFEQSCIALTKKPVSPDPEECARNPRARSARLRALEKR